MTDRSFNVLYEPTEHQLSEMNTLADAMLKAVGKIDLRLLWNTGVFTYASDTGQLPEDTGT